MSDDAEKTEEATQKKRDDARDEGRIARSPEMAVAAALVGSAMVLRAVGPSLAGVLEETMYGGLAGIASASNLDAGGAVDLLRTVGFKAGAALALACAAITAVPLAINALQARGVVSMKAIAPKFERLNPLTNAKRMLGAQPWVELVKSLLKLAIIAAAVWPAVRGSLPDILALAQEGPSGLLEVVRLYSLTILMRCGLAYLAIAGADYAYQWWTFEKSIKMSKEEVKQESKQSEGDPMVKSRMRALGRQRARNNMMKDVPKADLVLVNPTHIAIALQYDPDRAPAPIVLAMGERKVAERIKQLAFEHGVPVVQNIPLARALIRGSAVGQMIPAELYLAVAEVLAFVMKQRILYGRGWRGTAVA